MSFAILGLGTALPPYPLTQERATALARVLCLRPEQAPLVPVLYRQTEIDRRHIAITDAVVDDVIQGTRSSQSIFLPNGLDDDHGPTTAERMRFFMEAATPLALESARGALAESGLAAQDLTHIVTVTCTGFSAPGIDYELIRGLGMAPTVERLQIGFMGCHGAINGLRLARALTGAHADARVLLCAVELCSIHFHYGWDPKRVVANALFADGSASVVGVAGSRTTPERWQVAATGSCLFPDSREAMTWNIGNHGFTMTLSTRVPNLIEAHLRPWLEDWLGQHDLTIDAIGSWAVHPGGPRVLVSVQRALGLAPDAVATSREILAGHGNMSSPTVLFILDRLRRQQAPRPCVAMAFGPGLVVEAALLV